MEPSMLAQKQAQFDEFFLMAHPIRVNVRQLPTHATLPSDEELELSMPYAFRLASELATIEAQALRPLRNLGEHASDLVDYLQHQARKIDLMMSYILQQQDDISQRLQAIKFGGAGLIIGDDKPWQIGELAELKLFLQEEAAAIFCYGEVIACQQQEDSYHISFLFARIREQDQELLVRASLHLQAQQLKRRSQRNASTR